MRAKKQHILLRTDEAAGSAVAATTLYDVTSDYSWCNKLQVEKLSHYRPGQAITALVGWDSRNFFTVGTWRRQGCQPYAPSAFTPRENPLSRPQGHSVAGGIRSMKNPNDPIGNLCLFCPYCTTHTKQTSMPPAGFKPAIPASDRPQTLALDSSATGIGWNRTRYLPPRSAELQSNTPPWTPLVDRLLAWNVWRHVTSRQL